MEGHLQQRLRPVLYRRSASEAQLRSGILLDRDKKGRQYVMSLDTLGIEQLPAASTLTDFHWEPYPEVYQLLQRIAFTNDGRPRRWREAVAKGTDSLGRERWTGCGAGPVHNQALAAMLADLRRVHELGRPPINYAPAGPDSSKLWEAVCEYLGYSPQTVLDMLTPHVPKEVLAAEVAAGFTLTQSSSHCYQFPVQPPEEHQIVPCQQRFQQQHVAQPASVSGTRTAANVERTHHFGSDNSGISKPAAVEHQSGHGTSQAPGNTALQSLIPQQQQQQHLGQPRLVSSQYAASHTLGQLVAVQGNNLVERQPGQQQQHSPLLPVSSLPCPHAYPQQLRQQSHSSAAGVTSVGVPAASAADTRVPDVQQHDSSQRQQQQQQPLPVESLPTGVRAVVMPQQPQIGFVGDRVLQQPAVQQQVLAVPVHYQQQQTVVPLGAPWNAVLPPATALQPLLACTGNLDLQQLASQLPFTCLAQQRAVTRQPPAVAHIPPHLPAAAIGQRALPAAAACRAPPPVLQPVAGPIAAAVQRAAVPAFAAALGQAAPCAASSRASLADVMSQGDVIAISCLDADDQPLGHVKLHIDKFLGQGGNGAAFLATLQQSSSSTIHEALEAGLQVVIKVPLLLLQQVSSSQQPPPETAATAAEYTWAKKEYAVMQETKECPHIVVCYAHGRLQHCSKPYIQLPVIMLEYCNLGSWGDLLFPGASSSRAVIKRDACTVHHVMKGLLAAVVFLTDSNILHSDVKPDNVFFKGRSLGSCRAGAPASSTYSSLAEAFPFEVKLADFGCARFKPGGMARTRNVGTRAFHAPEMGSKEVTNYGSLADSYAAGLCLLVGRCGIKCPFNYMGKRFADLTYAEARQVAMERCEQLPAMYGKDFCANEIEFATGSLEADPSERWTPYMMARSAYIKLGPTC